MALALFHVTLLVLLISVVAAATCLSTFMVTRQKIMSWASFGFFFYFLDVALVLQDEYVAVTADPQVFQWYLIIRSVFTLLTGWGFLTSFYLMLCTYMDEQRPKVRYLPPAIFLIGGLILLPFSLDSTLGRFAFYSLRIVFLFAVLTVIVIRTRFSDSTMDRTRVLRHRRLIIIIGLLGALVLIEDLLFFVVWQTESMQLGPLRLLAERNYAENVLMIFCAVVICRHAFLVLRTRFDNPQTYVSQEHELIQENLLRYASLYHITAREQEVLYLILLGKDNQNIASGLHLASSTVKVHIHNILKKTAMANRQELIRHFWETA